MTGFTDRTAQAFLNFITGKAAIFALPTAYVGLFTAVGTDAGAGFTEVSGTAYARVATAAATWNTASGSAPSQISNAAAIAFPQAGAAWGTIIAFGLFDALTAGNLLLWDYLGNFAWQPASVSAASPAVFTQHAHGYANGNSVVFSTEFGGVAPAGGTFTGLLTVAGATTDTYNVGVNSTATGNGDVRRVASQAIINNNTATFAAGTLLITSA